MIVLALGKIKIHIPVGKAEARAFPSFPDDYIPPTICDYSGKDYYFRYYADSCKAEIGLRALEGLEDALKGIELGPDGMDVLVETPGNIDKIRVRQILLNCVFIKRVISRAGTEIVIA